jgi:tetratricopeptide (TPR) repeat protein
MQALSPDPPDVDAARTHIERYEREQRWNDVARASEELVLRTLATETDLERLTRAYLALREYEKGTALLLDRVSKTTDTKRRASLYMQLGELASVTRHDSEALEYVTRALELGSTTEALVKLGDAFVAAQDFKRARFYYQRAIVLDTGNVPARLALARIDEQQNQLADAAAHYHVLLRSHDGRVVARAGSAALLLAELLQTLPELEAELTRLGTPAHRLVLVELYRVTNNASRLEQLAQFDLDPDVRHAAAIILNPPSLGSPR